MRSGIKNVNFFCNCAGMCELHTRHKDLFTDMIKPLHVFAQTSDSDTDSDSYSPFSTCHHTQHITDLQINGCSFLSQPNHVTIKY